MLKHKKHKKILTLTCASSWVSIRPYKAYKASSSITPDKRIKRDTKKLEEVENDPTYTDERRPLYRDRLDDLKTEKQARLEILSQYRNDLQTQVARIKQTIEKVFDQNTSLAERIRTFFRGQGITIFSILTALSMTI